MLPTNPPELHQSKHLRIIIAAGVIVGLFLVFGLMVKVWGLQGVIAVISGDFSVITNGAGSASITIKCSTDNFQNRSGYCDGDLVDVPQDQCEGDWVPELQKCCVGGSGWVDPWIEYAAITNCTEDSSYTNCSCSGGTSCEKKCAVDFPAGLNLTHKIIVTAKDSFQNTNNSQPHAITVDTREFKVNSIEFTDSEGMIVDPRSSQMFITVSLPVGSIDASRISFNPPKAAIDRCSFSDNVIICDLQKKGTMYGEDIYFVIEDIKPFTVSIPIGSAISSEDTHRKPLKIGFVSSVFHIGCVLRKVTLAAVEALPKDDVLVGKDDLWANCDSNLGQEKRSVKLRHLDCHLQQVEERRGCQQTPVILKKIIRTDYSDLSATITQEDKDSGRASFGPLKSVLIIKGDYFYSAKDTVCGSIDWADRTFTEVWMGKDPAIKIAGIGCFSRAPYLDNIYNNGINQPFIVKPSCSGQDLNGAPTNCLMEVSVRQEVPECTDKVEVRAVVQPKIYQTVKDDPLKWDDGNQPWGENQRQEKKGEETFVVVPSTFDSSKFRGARFNFNWANQQISAQVIKYLNSIGAKQNQGVVGLPLSFTLEDIYETGPMPPRYCAVSNPDETVCTAEQSRTGNCMCGFGRKNYPDDVTTDFIKIKFYNGASPDPAESEKIIRQEKDVSLWEVGKPWNKFKIFPIVPFLDEEAKPGITRAYVCGNNIGFIESKENFELLQQDVSDVFAVSKVSPFWGDEEAGYPFVWGYNLKPKKGHQVIAKIDTWQGEKNIPFVPVGSTYGYLSLLADDLHPLGTALGDLEFCRDNFCVIKSHQNVYKEKYHPTGEGRVPRIDQVSSLKNWQAEPFPIYEDIPFVENFCADQEVVIQGSDFGDEKGQVLFWQGSGWSSSSTVSIEFWSKEEIKVKIKTSSIGKSADCAKEPRTLAEVSNLTLPAKVCDIQGRCQILDQKNIKAVPRRRIRLVDEKAPLKENYCLNDRILIAGLEFGEQRLGAKIKIAGQEVGRYIKWSDTEIIVTPPPIYGGRRSPFCPRTDERNKDGLLTTVKKGDAVIIDCPPLPSGARKCRLSEVKLLAPYEFKPAPIYQYKDDFKYFNNICLNDEVEITGAGFGDEQGAGKVEFWSNEDGWDEANRYELWSNSKLKVLPPQISLGTTSPDCPRQSQSPDKEGEVSIFKGPIRVCAAGECQYLGLDSTNINTKIKIYKKTLTNKQYLVNEEVKITGEFFSDIRSEDEFEKSGANQNDKRNTGYVEFYSNEIGWAPAGGYVKWGDNEIIVKAPKISLENKYGGPDAGVSIASQPVRICTSSGCSTNLVNFQKPEIVESIFDDPNWILKGFNFGNQNELGQGSIAYKTGDWWKIGIINNWSDNKVSFSFQGSDAADMIRFCRADEKCLFWDLAAKTETVWHYPEVFTVSPICLPAKKAVEQMAQDAGIYPEEVKVLLTVYGKDLDKEVISPKNIFDIELSNGQVLSGVEIYDDATKYKFRQQYYDKLVLRVPSFKVEVPEPIDPKKREKQVITGTLFLKSPFSHKNKIEVSNAITFSDYCQQEISCLNAPMITATNNKSYVGEDKDKAVSLAPDSSAIINGCNLGSGEGSSIVFGDVYQFNDLAARSNWQTNNVNITTPFGAKSGFLAPNVWTGLLEYSTPRTNLLFNVLPT
ncbi:MAG: hypothetical protein ABH896_03690, partial [Candidatus Jacksonbacteria bacterium]